MKVSFGVLALLSLVFAQASFAETWVSRVNCDGGLAEVDQDTSAGYPAYQLVLRRELAQWAKGNGITQSTNDRGELIFKAFGNSAYTHGTFEVFYGPSNQDGSVALESNQNSFKVTLNGHTISYNLNSCSQN